MSKVLKNTKKKLEDTRLKVAKLEKDAYDTSRDATTTKRRAEDALAKLRKFMKDLDSKCCVLA